jgi:hypothetical protein
MLQGFESYVHDKLDSAIERDFCLFAVTILYPILFYELNFGPVYPPARTELNQSPLEIPRL